MENKNVISIKNLIKRFPVGGDYFTALQHVNLELSKGEFIGLVGPSGSGKTTLLNIIGGLDSATDGSVSVLRNSILYCECLLCIDWILPKCLKALLLL